MRNTSDFTRTLVSAGPAADRTTKMDLYGWLIGDWVFDATMHLDNGTTHMGQGEIHFAWALEGRAIQDVGFCPGCSTARRCASTTPRSMHGTSSGAIP